MTFPAWRQQLVRSLHIHRAKADAKYFQVATVSPQGLPKLRTMVFRGFEDDTNTLLAVTDIRSDKIADWKRLPKTELHWYFAKTREQYRITCGVQVIDERMANKPIDTSSLKSVVGNDENNIELTQRTIKLYKVVWAKLSENAKHSFFCATPKIPIGDESIIDGQEGKEISPYFAVVRFIPTSVDYLNLKTQVHTRIISSLAENTEIWSAVNVNP